MDEVPEREEDTEYEEQESSCEVHDGCRKSLSCVTNGDVSNISSNQNMASVVSRSSNILKRPGSRLACIP